MVIFEQLCDFQGHVVTHKHIPHIDPYLALVVGHSRPYVQLDKCRLVWFNRQLDISGRVPILVRIFVIFEFRRQLKCFFKSKINWPPSMNSHQAFCDVGRSYAACVQTMMMMRPAWRMRRHGFWHGMRPRKVEHIRKRRKRSWRKWWPQLNPNRHSWIMSIRAEQQCSA